MDEVQLAWSEERGWKVRHGRSAPGGCCDADAALGFVENAWILGEELGAKGTRRG
jgi:hypothetical protein